MPVGSVEESAAPTVVVPTVVVGAVTEGPAPMPKPYLCAGSLGRIDIRYLDDNREENIASGMVLASSSNGPRAQNGESEYGPELDRYINTRESLGTRYYWLTRKLKKTIFGEVHHALVVEPSQADPSDPNASTSFHTKEPKQEVAVKIYFREKLRNLVNRTSENPTQELAAMQLLPPHPHVMTLEDCCYDAENVYGIMEFYNGGEMFEIIKENEDAAAQPLKERQAREYFLQILGGTVHMHAYGIAHRDMSLENVMCRTNTTNCKIIDFGMCQLVPRDSHGRFLRIRPHVACGKKYCMAPEVLANNEPLSPMKSDVWALGVILFVLITGYPPMEAATWMDARFQMISRGRLSDLLSQWGYGHLSREVQDLLHKLLRPDPIERITLEEVSRHEWFNLLLP